MFGRNLMLSPASDDKLITVVIPSLGQDQLKVTLDKLIFYENFFEIIVVLPINTQFVYNSSAVKIIYCKTKGQVAQRSIGIQSVKTDFVLLIDDDITVSENAINAMYDYCTNHENVAVAPVLCNIETRSQIAKPISKLKLLFYRLIFRVKDPGSFNTATIALNYINDGDLSAKEVQWVPGGLIMMRTEQTLKHDYFLGIEGKAFSEDVLASHLRSKNFNVKHVIIPSITAFTECDKGQFNIPALIQTFNTRLKVARLMGANRYRAAVMISVETILVYISQKL